MDTREDDGSTFSRWALLRDLLKFQGKLLVDGLRDLALSPLSIIAVAWGLLTERRRPDRHFRDLVDFGARSERWINLFGQHDREDAEPGIDELFGRLEARVLEQYERGGMTAQAKEAIDRAFDRLQDHIDPIDETPQSEGRSAAD
ncbi:MAG: hypothetical protein AAGE01_04715 [Pseudomonadota bacterium]